jgi:endonuclease-8
MFRGDVVRATSPQGRFTAGAALIDGTELVRAEAYGKHLLVRFGAEHHLHVHLGLYGTFVLTAGPTQPPRGAVRLRLESASGFADLRGATRCELLTRRERRDVVAGLGPDPLRRGADGTAAYERISRSSRGIGSLLMQQDVVAGIGNVYRAELLFRHGVDPFLPGRALPRDTWDGMWADLRALMRVGVRTGRIDTTRREHSPRAMRRPPRKDRHGGDVYVYRRAGDACYVCGAEVLTRVLEGRNLFWCPRCQPPGAGGPGAAN